MIPGMNPAMVKKAMKQMGIKETQIEATEVIIKTPGKNLVFQSPDVSMIQMSGQKTFQIVGNPIEESPISEDDIKTVAEQADVSEDEAKKALEEKGGDLAEAIMSLSN